jgi:hypothetical protein
VDNSGGWKFNNKLPDSIPMAIPKELIAVKRIFEVDPSMEATTGR